jgi:hypothetical protein
MKIFFASSLSLFDKIGHFPATNFCRPRNIFGACFQLFGRKFGHLATVYGTHLKGIVSRKFDMLFLVPVLDILNTF